MNAYWNNCFAPQVDGDRGWLHVECEPFSIENRRNYTSATMPVMDQTAMNTGWREQSSLGWYLEYSHDAKRDGDVLAHCCINGATEWFRSCERAQRWIEQQVVRLRPELAQCDLMQVA